MVVTIEEMKKEILDWVKNTDDAAAIKQLYQLKAAYKTPFSFDEEWNKALTGEEVRNLTEQKIREWWPK